MIRCENRKLKVEKWLLKFVKNINIHAENNYIDVAK
jgi:hypothetical protein